MALRSTSLPMHKYTQTSAYWYTETPVHQYTGTLVNWYTKTLVHGYSSTPVHRYTGTQVPWYLVEANYGTTELCPIIGVSKPILVTFFGLFPPPPSPRGKGGRRLHLPVLRIPASASPLGHQEHYLDINVKVH